MRRNAWLPIVGVAVAAQVLMVEEAQADSTNAVMIGVVRDAKTGAGIEGAVAIVTGDKIQGERVVVTDVSGLYRLPNLPVGEYDLTILHKDYGEGKRRKGIKLRANSTIRIDISLMQVGGDKRVIEVPAPTVDVGSSSTGLSIDKEMAKRVPIATPGGKGAANRSFEAIAEATPGASSDTYGTSVAGTTSPENKYQIDGLSVNDPGFGLNGTALTVEFLEQVSVEAGGYMPEYGRATGGIVNAVTKTGSNEFHGGVWGFFTPGGLEGQRQIPVREGSTLQTQTNLGWLGDTGFDLGGRLIKDKLWFYGGVSVSRSVYKLNTSWNRTVIDRTGSPDPDSQFYNENYGGAQINANGFTVTERLPGSTVLRNAQGTTVQALGKLTYRPAKGHTLELLGIYAPSLSGGNGTYGIDQRTGQPEVANPQGDYNSLANRYRDSSSDVQLKWLANTEDQKWTFDTTLGWHHQVNQRMAADGTGIGSGNGLSAVPGVIYRRGGVGLHEIIDLPDGVAAGACNPYTLPGQTIDATTICPYNTYSTGGPGFLADRSLDRMQVRSMFTRLAQGAGHHLIKGGVDFEYMGYSNNRGYSGETLYRETASGSYFQDYRQYGYLTGPDEAQTLNSLQWNVRSTTIGGFIQDSWAIMDKVTLNAGLRYDAQHLFSGDGALAMALPNQLSPRAGLIWDPTQAGKAKLAVNYARYFQSIPLNLADRAGSGEPSSYSYHDVTQCDPTDVDEHNGICQNDSARLAQGGPTSPDQYWGHYGAGKTAIDPKLKPQTSDEIVAIAEYEIFPDGRLGAQYTHRWLTRVIEDMSRDEATTYFIGNPGYGIAKDFPKASRVYDSAVVYLDKRFNDHWLLTGSYTASWLRGNIAGLFRPETGQLDPGINSDFDLISLLDNRTGYLPGDTRHVIKVFSAGEIVLPRKQAILLGGAVRARSGRPINVLGSHALYGYDEAFLLPRGSYGRTPWNFQIDTNIGYSKQFSKDVVLSVTMDIFNVANFQQVLAVDQRYTVSDVQPMPGAGIDDLKGLKDINGEDLIPNPNFGKPVAYQRPRMFRFGVRLTF